MDADHLHLLVLVACTVLGAFVGRLFRIIEDECSLIPWSGLLLSTITLLLYLWKVGLL
jgi:uncharacterized membrane protein